MSEAKTEPIRFTRGPDDEYVCAECRRIFGSRPAVFAHYGLPHGTVPRGRRGPKVKKAPHVSFVDPEHGS